jgi:PKD repeat protein
MKVLCRFAGILLAVLLLGLVVTLDCVVAQDDAPDVVHDRWSSFKYPKVIVVDKDRGETAGSALVHKLIPDLESFIQKIALGVCQKLYTSAEEVPEFEQLTFVLEDYRGVAGKSGHPPKITIQMSTRYLERQHARMGDEAIKYEIAGVNWHELTHAYQHIPKEAGSYQRGTDHFGFIEGTADAVRILAGFHKTREPRPGGHWNDGYTTTGFFIAWLTRHRDPDLLYKLNQSCQTLTPWSWDQAAKTIVDDQTSVAQLWKEYQWDLKGGGQEAVASFEPACAVVCEGQSIHFQNTSFNSPDSYQWTFPGGTPASSRDPAPVVNYRKPGEYEVTLLATNQHGSTTKRVESCVNVLERTGRITQWTARDGLISHKSAASAMPGEEVENLLDGDSSTKFCVKSRSTRVEYILPQPGVLCAYALTSANDAPGRDPKEWVLEASHEGNTWKAIDRQEGQIFASRFQTKRYVVPGTAAYRYYRWSLTSKSDPIFQFADLSLYGLEQ